MKYFEARSKIIFVVFLGLNLVVGCADTASTRQAQDAFSSLGKLVPNNSQLKTLSKNINTAVTSGSNLIEISAPKPATVFVQGTPEMPLVAGQHWYGNYGCGNSRQVIMSRIETVGPKELATDRILVTGATYFTYHRGRANNGMRYTNGSFTTSGTYSPSTRLLILKPVQWIEQPPGFRPLGIIANVSSDGGTITGDAVESSSSCPTTVIMNNGDYTSAALPIARNRTDLQRELSNDSFLTEKARVAGLTPAQRKLEKKQNAERAAQWNAAAPILVEMFIRMATTSKPQSGCDSICQGNEELRKDQARRAENAQDWASQKSGRDPADYKGL